MHWLITMVRARKFYYHTALFKQIALCQVRKFLYLGKSGYNAPWRKEELKTVEISVRRNTFEIWQEIDMAGEHLRRAKKLLVK